MAANAPVPDRRTRRDVVAPRHSKADHIVQSARALYERQGVRATTVKQIASEAGLTRELLYYYFRNKAAITQAVLDAYVAEFVESVALWCAEPRTTNAQMAFVDFIRVFRRGIFKRDGDWRPMHAVLIETNRQFDVIMRVVRECARYLEHEDLFIAMAHRTGVGVETMTAFALFGTIGLLEIDASIPDEAIAALVEDTFMVQDPSGDLGSIVVQGIVSSKE